MKEKVYKKTGKSLVEPDIKEAASAPVEGCLEGKGAPEPKARAGETFKVGSGSSGPAAVLFDGTKYAL